jgi:hypothetical protein
LLDLATEFNGYFCGGFMKLIPLFLSLSFSLGAHAETVMKCSVNKLGPYKGARINLLQSNGKLRANLIFGTTVSGTMYGIYHSGAGFYFGKNAGQKDAWLKLEISPVVTMKNNYIEGHLATLEVVYPDLNSKTGVSYLKTSTKDLFVCGKQINSFGN